MDMRRIFVVEGGICCGKSSVLEWVGKHGRKVTALLEPKAEWSQQLAKFYAGKRDQEMYRASGNIGQTLLRLQLQVLRAMIIRWELARRELERDPERIVVLERSVASALVFIYANADEFSSIVDFECLDLIIGALGKHEERGSELKRILVTCDEEKMLDRSAAKGENIPRAYLKLIKRDTDRLWKEAALATVDTTDCTIEECGRMILGIIGREETDEPDAAAPALQRRLLPTLIGRDG